MSVDTPAVLGHSSDAASWADSGLNGATMSAMDLPVLREQIVASGGGVGTVTLSALLAQGPSALMAAVLDAIDPELVFVDAVDLPEPSAVSAEIMARIARDEADAGRLVLLQLWKRQEAWTASRSMTIAHAYACRALDQSGREFMPFDVSRSGVAAEVGLVTGVCGATADARIAQSALLNPEGVLSATHAALSHGLVTESVARLMADAVDGLTPEQIAGVEARVLPKLLRFINPHTRHGAPAGYTYAKQQLARAIARVAPERSREKSARAKSQRGAKFRILEDDDLAQLTVWLPKVDGIAAWERLQDAAAAAQAADRRLAEDSALDPIGVRTINQCRADVLHDALMGLTPAAGAAVTALDADRTPRMTIGVLIDLPTLLALRDNPAEIPGYGPLDPELARALAADNEWRRFIHEPLTGQLLDLGHTRYEPSRRLREFIHARDPKCTFPGCGQQARRSQLDHIQPWPQGPTDRDNLHPLCVHHHNLKTHGRWQVARDPDTGETTWRSPRGLEARSPHPYVPMPDEDDGPPPF